ncbi:MAG: SMC-Scp complex subunit ScpB [Planctomycetota bacterium]
MSLLGRHLNSPALRYRTPLVTVPPPAGRRLVGQRIASSVAAEEPSDHRCKRRQRLEAVLFLAREPLALRRLAKLANLADGTEARTLLRQLNQTYATRGSAFGVEAVAGGYQLLTRSKLAPWIKKFSAPSDEVKLTPSAMETLAVVAYRQPVLRVEVEAIRGVQCGELLRQLMERDLLRIVGRSEELGRPLLYGTTKRFLQRFGLKDLEGLPSAEELRRRDPAEIDSAKPNGQQPPAPAA